MLVYSLFDRKLKEYGSLVVVRNDETIRRSVVDGIRGSKSLIELHPEDFDVICVGSFDTESGVLHGEVVRRLVANVGEIMEAFNANG